MKTNSPQKISPKKKTHKEKFLDDVKLCAEQQYRQAYRDLKLRQRVERVEEIGKQVVSACIDKKKVREGGLDYIVSDDNLRTDVQTFLCELRLRLEKELKCNFKMDESVTPSPEEIVEEENVEPTTSGVEECRYFKREDYFGSDNMFYVATKLLGKLTMTGYNEIRKNIIEEYRIPSIWLPSFAKLTSNRPKVFGFDVTPTLNTLVTNPPPDRIVAGTKTQFIQDMEDAGLFFDDTDINDSFLADEVLIPKVTPGFGLTAFVGQDMSMKEVMTQFKSSQKATTVQASRIEGTYAGYIKLLTDQHEKKGFSPLTQKLVVIDSHDGAEHGKTNKNITNIVSFSSKVVSKKSLDGGYGGGSSLDILTWQQMIGEEKPLNIFPAVNDYLLEKYEMIQNMSADEKNRINFYELHDGKMLYLLTQHSLYNRKYHPFLLCTCGRGEGLKKKSQM